jgi:hypothetical protein
VSAFRDARLKVKRANEHLEELAAAIVALEKTYVSRIEPHPLLNAQSLVHEVPNVENALLDLSLIVGDIIHNLRTALDFAWYSTISKCLPDKISDCTKFPVRQTRQNLAAALHGIEVDTRCKRLFDCMMSDIQPFKGSHNSAVWTVHDLDICDKHLLLLELAPQGYIRGITLRDRNGGLHPDGATWAVPGAGPYCVDYVEGIKIEDKGNLSFAITLADAGMYKVVEVESLLSSFTSYTLHVIRLLENVTAGNIGTAAVTSA